MIPCLPERAIFSRINRLEDHRSGRRLAVNCANETQDPRCSSDLEDRPKGSRRRFSYGERKKSDMKSMMPIAKIISIAFLLFQIPVSTAERGGCYSTGEGPFMTCFEGTRKVQVMKPFKSGDGKSYTWDHQLNSYCSRDSQRCMQNWEVKNLHCSEDENGRLVCD
jgi:hypothetical protein